MDKKKVNTKIAEFQGENRWLSNFVSPPICFDGCIYPTVEHAYQAAKTESKEEREKIRNCPTSGRAKNLGRLVTIRDGWEEVKLSIMESLLRQKFSQEPYRTLLLNTGDTEIEEGNYWGDTFWGTYKGIGTNHLGRIIMKIRDENSE